MFGSQASFANLPMSYMSFLEKGGTYVRKQTAKYKNLLCWFFSYTYFSLL